MDIPESGREPALPPSRQGRRRFTPSMAAAQDELNGPPPATPSKRDILNTLKSLRGQLPVSRSATSTLIAMIEKTRPDDWEPLETPFIYAHNTTLMSWTGLSRTALQRHIRELADAKLLVAQDGRNGQRGRRWQGADGEVRVGFNLSSLRFRWPELVELLADARRRRERVSFLCGAIADLNDQVRASAERAGLEQIARDAMRLMRARLRTTTISRLEAYHSEMVSLHQAVGDAAGDIAVDNRVESCAYTPETEPMGPDFGAHYTDTKDNQSLNKVVPVAAKGRNRIEAMRSAKSDVPADLNRVDDRAALRGFKGTALFYLEICSRLREFCVSARPSADELVVAAGYLSGEIGVSYHAWTQARAVLGPLQAAIAIIIMAARLERGAVIYRRDAYLRALTERGCRSQLYLDRSLYALRDARARELEPARREKEGSHSWHGCPQPELQIPHR
ncbi:replicator initiator RepC [Gluconacetobacter sp. 1b LMG 1731]|uniref:Replicator initiator RepC n=1 Tax=Gluconacetobacter dulcium TaxID=2729096 RepID=A0A7W4IPH9_9PROT|nr:replication initiation protein RepC [Gluconacetobacter dulcium]MBB2166564.1 replicator initiator RepC [Gluconacetobacter dulcium]MBB2195666.1 replicator initiator RepC [Gluconacetobacter dulcium]